jgi:hypothetical protein
MEWLEEFYPTVSEAFKTFTYTLFIAPFNRRSGLKIPNSRYSFE